MKFFVLLTSLIFSFSADAATRLQFLIGDRNAIAIIVESGIDGSTDTDWKDLMDVMNVPIQNSPLGPGKSLATQSRDFNLICGEARKQCQVFLNASSRAKIQSAKKRMSFQVSGEEAREFRKRFYPETMEPMVFQSTDGKFTIEASETEFLFVGEER